jgi:hypothetical protein
MISINSFAAPTNIEPQDSWPHSLRSVQMAWCLDGDLGGMRHNVECVIDHDIVSFGIARGVP